VPGWQMIAVDTDVTQIITSWYHFGANGEMVVVTTWRSDVYHLLHMCHILIKVIITFWH